MTAKIAENRKIAADMRNNISSAIYSPRIPP
jgi:hypothetical protein